MDISTAFCSEVWASDKQTNLAHLLVLISLVVRMLQLFDLTSKLGICDTKMIIKPILKRRTSQTQMSLWNGQSIFNNLNCRLRIFFSTMFQCRPWPWASRNVKVTHSEVRAWLKTKKTTPALVHVQWIQEECKPLTLKTTQQVSWRCRSRVYCEKNYRMQMPRVVFQYDGLFNPWNMLCKGNYLPVLPRLPWDKLSKKWLLCHYKYNKT